jgi:hypothetical protein
VLALHFIYEGDDLSLTALHRKREVSLMKVAEALSLMVIFAAFAVALITLIVHLIRMNNKK